MFEILSICKGGGYRYCKTNPPHPRRNSKGLYPLHRVLAENRLGRLLEPGEDVHHKDEDKANDVPDNLEVLPHAEHSRQHALETAPPPVRWTCRCGVQFTLKPAQFRLRIKRNVSGEIYCSRSCGARYQAH